MIQTDWGWRTDYRDFHDHRIRDEYDTHEEAARAQKRGKTRKQFALTEHKLGPYTKNILPLRCAQRERGKRCRRLALQANEHNGKPSCLRHTHAEKASELAY